MSGSFTLDWKAMSDAAGGFPPAAFDFVREGLKHTVDRVHGVEAEAAAHDEPALPEISKHIGFQETLGEELSADLAADLGAEGLGAGHHVSGADLCLGLRELAIDRYGRLAKTVLHRWRVRETADFGRIVFAMIDAGLLSKTDEDSFDDFVNVYDFEEAFHDADLN